MKRLYVFFIALTVFFMFGCSEKKAEQQTDANEALKDIKAAFIYVGPVGDGGWTYAHDLGRQEMAKLPYVKDIVFIESVPEGAEAARIIRNLAVRGFNLIFTTSYGYLEPTMEVAKEFPDTVFMHCSGHKISENTGSYFGRIYQPRYLTGIVAGKATESNIIGYVAAFPIPEVIRGINAFTLGVRSVNPQAVVRVMWTNTWFDPGKERKAADMLLDSGADIITMHQDTPAPLQAAEKRGKLVIGYNSDMSAHVPSAWLTAAVWNWKPVYINVAEQVHNGTWKPENIWYGMEQGLTDIAPMSKLVPQDVQDMVNRKRAELMAGKDNIFTGPIKDNNGELVVENGKALSDEEKLNMSFLVEGVETSDAR